MFIVPVDKTDANDVKLFTTLNNLKYGEYLIFKELIKCYNHPARFIGQL